MKRHAYVVLLAVLLSGVHVGATTTYYIAGASCADSNNGTTKTTPWCHAPGMSGFTGSYTSAAGDQIIFRGGDTWHFGNSALTPYVGSKTWTYSHSGASGNPIYIGVDQTWFSGGSWVRPIFTGDDAITNAIPSSCTYDYNNVNVVLLGTDAHIRLDNFEMSGFCFTGTSGVNAGFVNFGGTDAIIENMYFHGITAVTTTSGFDDEQVAIHGSGVGFKGDLTNQCLYNIYDNSDGTLGNSGSYAGNNGKDTLEAIQNACAVVAYSVFNRVSNGLVSSSTDVHDNLFHDMYEPQGGVHGNIWNVNNDGLVNIGTQRFYNNIVYNVNEGVGVWFQPTTIGYFFNNIIWNFGNPGRCLRTGGSVITSNPLAPVTDLYIYNNVFPDGSCKVNGVSASPGGDPAQSGPIYFANNQFGGYGLSAIPAAVTATTSTLSTSLTECDAPSGEPGPTICTYTDNGTNIWSVTGYSASNDWAPSSGSAVTVGTGTNFSSSCAAFSTDNALCSSIASVAEIAGSGGMIASYPATTVNVRPPSSPWDIGPYQFTSSTPPSPPSGLSVLGVGF